MEQRAINTLQVFQKAAALHAQGRLEEAERLYDLVLTKDGRHFDSIFRLGLICLEKGRLNDAEQLLGRAVEINDTSADAHFQLAGLLTDNGRLEAAVAHYQKALALRPGNIEARSRFGDVLQVLERFDEAAKQYKRVLAARPRFAEAHCNLAGAFVALERYDEAIVHCQRAIAIRPQFPEAHMNFANALEGLDRYEEAISHCRQALAIEPGNIKVLNQLTENLAVAGRLEDAVDCCQKALAIEPEHLPTLNILGSLHWKSQRLQQARTVYDRALAVEPDNVSAWVNRGMVQQDLGLLDEALAGFARAQAIDPFDASAHFAEAYVRLRLGDLRAGFEKYEWRWRKKDADRRVFDKPMWLGENIGGKTVLVHAEGGFGNTIQFCRYIKLLAARGAKVVLVVQPSLKSLLASLVEVDTVIGVGERLPAFDVHCPVASLPLAFKTNLATIPGKTPYLTAPADRIALWEQRLGPKSKPRVGLAWSGNPKQGHDHFRSTALSNLLPLLSPDLQFFSLQKDVRKRDLETLKGYPDLLHLGDELADFADTAAIISLMDVVISVCTAVGHLSGALNRPTWFLLSASADWRWLLDRNDSPWYPSARLFRQPSLGDWASVVDQMASELAKLR